MASTDFDFVIVRWAVTNRKRADMLDPDCTDWSEFASTGEHRLLPGGAGNTLVRVRFLWDDLGPETARWQQAFSHDGEQTWDTNWVMDMTRLAN